MRKTRALPAATRRSRPTINPSRRWNHGYSSPRASCATPRPRRRIWRSKRSSRWNEQEGYCRRRPYRQFGSLLFQRSV